MKILEITKNKFEAIVQSYIGMTPKDKGCLHWSEMQQKMAGELLEALEENPVKSEEEYYIQSGYVGNAMLWWRKDGKGYSTHFNEAGRYSKEDAMSIIDNRPKEDYAWLCSHVDQTKVAHLTVIEHDNLNTDFRIIGKRK